jgi:hypothetical protein
MPAKPKGWDHITQSNPVYPVREKLRLSISKSSRILKLKRTDKIKVIGIPLSAIINGERVIGPDLSDEAWADLKLKHKKGLDVIMTCGAKGHLRISPNGLKHFYHANKSENCGCEPESFEHLKLKNQVYQICKSEGWQVQLEYQSPSGDWRADVLAMKDERKIVFEIQLSIIDLNELKLRDSKYQRDGIESYWILKDFLKIFPYDDSKVVTSSNSGVFIDSYINESEFFLKREQLLFVEHGIRTIGIQLEDNYLYTADVLAIDMAEWVKSTLRREYEITLKDFENNYQKKQKLRDLAKPEMDKLLEFSSRRFEYDEEIKKIYAIFKNNKWEDRQSLQQDIRDMYSTYDTFKKAWGKIFSPKNGFVWKDLMDFGREEPIFNLISEIQITSIHNQIINLENEERKFLSIFKVVKEYVENNDKIIQMFCSNNIEHSDPNYYQNKKLDREQQYEDIRSTGKIIEKKPQEITKNPVSPKNKDLLFNFNPVLPTLLIESQRGWKYQNPTGCTWEINEDDAIEFEKKGYGKIKKYSEGG